MNPRLHSSVGPPPSPGIGGSPVVILSDASAMLAAGPPIRHGVPAGTEDGSHGERSNRMVTNTATEGWGRFRGRKRSTFIPAVILLAAAGVLGGSAAGAGAADILRWKFKPGETLRFSVEHKMVSNAKGMDIERKETRTHTLDFSWKVVGVGPGGEAEITHRVERIRMRVEAPPLMPFEFDSAASKPVQPGFEAQTRQLKKQVGVEFTFKMKPNGEIIDVKLPEETLKRLRDSAPAGGPEGEVSEQAIKETLLQESPPSFPEGPLEPGKSWSPRPVRVPLPFGALVLDRTFTYQGPDPRSPNHRLIDIQTTAKLEPAGGTDVKVAIRKQDGKGSMTVDAEAGRVVSTRMALMIELALSGMGQSIEQSTETTSSMTLLP